MLHLDLFSGIGGFAYAADQVFGDVEHIFCDNDKFCRAVLKKHWPEAKIYGNIRQVTADTYGTRLKGKKLLQQGRSGSGWGDQSPFLLTGGFPCQPFSAAGLRRGTSDERHLWPEMLRVIRLTKPTWIIAENVRGLLSWNEGMVFEQVCADMEAAGYEVWPFIIPAIAVDAPHRRDRVWFVGRNTDPQSQQARVPRQSRQNDAGLTANSRSLNGDKGRRNKVRSEKQEPGQQNGECGREGWNRTWIEVAAELCSVDDGLPARVGGLKLSKPQHRKEQLKAYGNAIVPQVAIEIMKGISCA